MDQPSTRPLLDKLGVKPGHRVALIGAFDPGFVEQLRARGASVSRRIVRDADQIYLAASDNADLRPLAGQRRLDQFFLQPPQAPVERGDRFAFHGPGRVQDQHAQTARLGIIHELHAVLEEVVAPVRTVPGRRVQPRVFGVGHGVPVFHAESGG